MDRVNVTYRTTAGAHYTRHNVPREQADAQAREFADAWATAGVVTGHIQFANAVIRSDAVAAVEITP